jgi:hypothetical protein
LKSAPKTQYISIFLVLEAEKPLIVVVNENLMNNHQTELAEKLGGDGYLEYCVSSTLCETIEKFDPSKLKPFPRGNLNAFGKFIDSLFPNKTETSNTSPKLHEKKMRKTSEISNEQTEKEEADYLR